MCNVRACISIKLCTVQSSPGKKGYLKAISNAAAAAADDQMDFS